MSHLLSTLSSWLIAIIGLSTLIISDASAADALADWTILIYMNGKNSLASYAVNNFLDIAKVQDINQVNILVEIGRPETQTNVGRNPEEWGGARRYKMKRGTTLASTPVLDLGSSGPATDMGVPATLEDFIQWSVANYKARHYAVVISSHGQGYRFQIQSDGSTTESQVSNTLAPPVSGGFRSVSVDDNSQHTLYNRQIQVVLESLLTKGIKIDVIGFDACSMAMIETAFAMRYGAKYMIASEELEPDSGWDYSGWLSAFLQLVQKGGEQTDQALALGKFIVSTYQQQGDSSSKTLSVVDLSKIEALAGTVAGVATGLISGLQSQRASIQRARDSDRWFGMENGQPSTSVDLAYLLTRLSEETSDSGLKALALSARASVRDAIVFSYASRMTKTENLGGEGLAIFFPPTATDFHRDPNSSGYLRSNRVQPVEFVQTNDWSRFIAEYLGVR